MATPYLGITHIAESQNEKEVTINDALDSLDNAMNNLSAIAMTDADYTATNGTVAGAFFFSLTGTLTADRNFIMPTGQERFFAIKNGTTGGHNIVAKTASGATATVPNGDTKLLYSDGTNVTLLT